HPQASRSEEAQNVSIRDQLARLRVLETGIGVSPADGAEPASRPTRSPQAASDASVTPLQLPAPLERDGLTRIGAYAQDTDDGPIIVREVQHAISTRHGHWRFSQLADVIALWHDSGRAHPLRPDRAESGVDLLFFDTETTGLHGGTGNTVFLLGCCRVHQDRVVVRQYFLPSPASELALYKRFVAHISDATHSVTFNGKAFDWPRVRTRHTLLRRAAPPLPDLEQIDLLHAARRIWRNDAGGCRLGDLEREKLGVVRSEDVGGSLAPILYMDYLHSGRTDALTGILRHNELDTLALVTLYIHLSFLVLTAKGASGRPATARERFAIGRWDHALGNLAQARDGLLASCTEGGSYEAAAASELGFVYKRLGEFDRCAQAWKHALRLSDRADTRILSELSVVFEHRLRRLDDALECALAARAALAKQRPPAAGSICAVDRRIARLESKLAAEPRAHS
ncbi:MAG: ribonuclease H-like domain-containing protein, partial [Firmicutes bacterium]|nr:ribonuclease H-like domain-containing protein [Bacillota bacterium]